MFSSRLFAVTTMRSTVSVSVVGEGEAVGAAAGGYWPGVAATCALAVAAQSSATAQADRDKIRR
jgi:hypothetical protein